MPEAFSQRWTIGDEHNQVWGADLVSAATIAPTHKYHVVSGTAAIVNITPPWNTFSGPIVLLFLGAATTTTAGNIGIAITAVANQAVMFVYNPALGKWYPVKY